MPEQSTEQLIKDHLAALPEPVRKAIASFDWAREVFDIGRKHSMHVDRIGELQTEVMLVVLGLVSPRDFQNELFDRIEPNRDIALEISDEVNQKVFIRIREYMKKYYEGNENNPTPSKSPEVIKEGELGSSEKNVLNSAGIKIGDEANEPNPPVILPAEDTEPESESIGGMVSLIHEEEEIAKPDPIIEKLKATMSKPEVRKSPITVITAENAPKGFLDPYREPVE